MYVCMPACLSLSPCQPRIPSDRQTGAGRDPVIHHNPLCTTTTTHRYPGIQIHPYRQGCIHISIQPYTHTYTHTVSQADLQARMHTCTHTHCNEHTCMRPYTHADMHKRMHTYTHAVSHIHPYTNTYVHAYTLGIHTGAQIQRHWGA